MNISNKLTIPVTLILYVIIGCLFFSCKKDLPAGASKQITVDSVTLHNATTTTTVITQASLGAIIRINGSGFSTAKAVYMNGVKATVNPNYLTEHSIIMNVPSTLPYGSDIADAELRNTIRIVTEYDDYTFRFPIKGPAPVISDVSHSLPKAGEQLIIYGTNLRDLDSVVLPGNVVFTAGQFKTSSDYSRITLTVPPNAITTAGGIYVHGDNGQAYSYNYMNSSNCVFIKQFSNDAAVTGGAGDCYQRAYNYGGNISGNQTALLPAAGEGHKNPETYRQVPAAAGDIAVNTTALGGFEFRTCPAVTSVLKTSNGAITPASLCNNLAVQFDVYINVEWSSGFIRFEWVKDNADWRYNYAPWAVNGNVVPVKMSGWQTVTIPLSAFKALNGKTFQNFMDQAVSKGGYFGFFNAAYTDASGKSLAANAIKGFQFSFGNFRIVPYVKGR
jgi:hypothetical protein